MNKNNYMLYKGYYGSVHFNGEEELFFGRIEFIRDLINYEASDAESLIQSFHEAVDDYLEKIARFTINQLINLLKAVLISGYHLICTVRHKRLPYNKVSA